MGHLRTGIAIAVVRPKWGAMSSDLSIAIIGAGMAGLSCARVLAAGGVQVRLFDKGRGPGGRLSTRRAQTPLGELRFDHGAQFFTARSDRFRQLVHQLEAGGHVARWTPRWAPGHEDGAERWTGTPGMNQVIKALSDGLDVSWSQQVSAIERQADGRLSPTTATGDHLGAFDAVLVAVPAEQAGALLRPLSPALADEADAARSEPCQAVMTLFDPPVLAAFDAWRGDDAVLQLAVRETGRPGRDGPDRWVLHATADWSRAHLEEPPEVVAEGMIAAFRDLTGAPVPLWSAAHRWRYARVEAPVSAGSGSPAGWNGAVRIGCCGDWRIGGRIEAAFLSGEALGQAVLAELAPVS